MASIQIDNGAPALTSPIPSSERIQALDVVRGFALIGIFLMNIEWFNRPIAELGGLPTNVHGADFWAGYLISHGENRVEARLRLLENHRDAVAADVNHLRLRSFEQVLAAKAHLALNDLTGHANQAHNRK